jgi:plastocyanin
MRRCLLLAALAFSAAVHAVLAPEHLREETLLGALFVAGATIELALVALLAARPSRAVIGAATAALGAMLVAYFPFVLFRLPGFPMTPEPLEPVALLTKAIELAGASVGLTLLVRPPSLSRRLAPAAAAIVVAAAAGAAAPPSLAGGAGENRSVDIPGTLFAPDTLPVLVGDTVTWANRDRMTHTVTADGDEFDSDRLEPGASFSFTFTNPGIYPYHCTIHRFMHGEIRVSAVALIGPGRSVPLGSTVTLRGLAPGGNGSVSLEKQQADGSYATVAAASPAADGSFSVPFAVAGPARLRVRAGDQLSGPVAIKPKPKVTIGLRRSGGSATIRIAATPGQAGASIAVERYIRERYLWVFVRAAALDADGHLTVTFPAEAHGLRLRAHLLHGRNGWGAATSGAVTLP